VSKLENFNKVTAIRDSAATAATAVRRSEILGNKLTHLDSRKGCCGLLLLLLKCKFFEDATVGDVKKSEIASIMISQICPAVVAFE